MKRPRPTYEIAELFPMQGDWTEEEYLALDTNRLVELSDGKLDVLPHPTSFHQFVLGCLVASILPHVEAQRLGRVLISAFPVRLWPGTFREPDLIFMSAAHRDRCGEEYWGVPDLVAEVMASHDRRRDQVVKRREYAQAGIPEYWLLDPRTATVEVHLLQGQGYQLARTLKAGDELTSAQVPEWGLAVAELFKAANEG